MRRRLYAELLEPRLLPSTYHLHQGDNPQTTIDLAQPGDFIYLDAGATFTGPLTLTAKANSYNQWITIATTNFPLSSGIRVSPSDAPSMAAILSPGLNLPAIQTEPGASQYILRGLNIMPVDSAAVVDTLVTLGDGSSRQLSASQQPTNIIIDQCFIHGWDGQTIKRGIALNDGGTTGSNGVFNSYVSDFKSTDPITDTQAICGWNGTGPYIIQNNYLEAAAENVLFGGAYSYIQKTPSNIAILDNTFSKPLSWNPHDPSYAGTAWSVKNLLEFKNAERVTVENNTFQNNWISSQNGRCIILTPRGDQSGGAWVTVSDVTIAHNTITGSAQGILILGTDDLSTTKRTTNITIQNNLFGDVASSNPEWGIYSAPPSVFAIVPGQGGGPSNVIIDHNTILHNAGNVLFLGTTVTGFQFTNNIAPEGAFGVFGDQLRGQAALEAFCPNYLFRNNVMVGGGVVSYPPGNAEPSTWSAVGFLDYRSDGTGNYLLASTSSYYGAGSNIAGFSTPLFYFLTVRHSVASDQDVSPEETEPQHRGPP